eukprot:598357-Hanusia_phi.AAC.1
MIEIQETLSQTSDSVMNLPVALYVNLFFKYIFRRNELSHLQLRLPAGDFTVRPGPGPPTYVTCECRPAPGGRGGAARPRTAPRHWNMFKFRATPCSEASPIGPYGGQGVVRNFGSGRAHGGRGRRRRNCEIGRRGRRRRSCKIGRR